MMNPGDIRLCFNQSSVEFNNDIVLTLGSLYRGPAGPAGDSGGPIQTVKAAAATALGGHRIVGALADGTYGYVSPDNAQDAFRAIGITLGSVNAGDETTVQTAGVLNEPSWNWIPFKQIYLGANSLPTQTIPQTPQSAFDLVVGVALSATTIVVKLQPPIFLI